MRFYHCFYTDLPDEFVEANASQLVDWVMRLDANCPRYIIDGVTLEGIPRVNSQVIIRPFGHGPGQGWDRLHNWMSQNKGKYSGGYWKSLAPDQCDPNRAARYTGRGHAYYSPPGAISNQGPGYRAGPSLTSPLMHAASQAYQRSIAAGMMTRSLYPGAWYDVPQPRPALKREIKMGEITGYRCWRIENGLLRSVFQKDIWYPGKILQGRELEDWGQRGVHAWKEPNSSRFLEYLMGCLAETQGIITQGHSRVQTVTLASNVAMVTGSVILWGDVVEHEYGYRGEFAKVKSLDWLYPSQDMMGKEQSTLDNLRREYGV
jgi:hypothetical protein